MTGMTCSMEKVMRWLHCHSGWGGIGCTCVLLEATSAAGGVLSISGSLIVAIPGARAVRMRCGRKVQ